VITKTGNLKLLCASCRSVNRVVEVIGDLTARLLCGHQRGELLPKSSPTAVGVEDLFTVDGWRLFPARHGQFDLTVAPHFVEAKR
jgi:hypothetical protein